MASCILYQDAGQTITLLDIPRSIEQAQGFHKDRKKRLISSEAIKQPFTSLEPKSAKALKNVEAASVRSLVLERFIALALEEVRTATQGPWCLPRVTQHVAILKSQVLKPKTRDFSEDSPKRILAAENNSRNHDSNRSHLHTMEYSTTEVLYQNEELIVRHLQTGSVPRLACIPPRSSFLQGDIETTQIIFNFKAPQYNLVIMDPPWPNRSARRKKSYRLSRDTLDVAGLLSLTPLASHFAEDVLVGIWVTNKPAIHDLILGTNGLFDSWGLEFAEEWVWLKVTTSGEPICALDSTWRKPYEILLVGRKKGPDCDNAEFKRRVIIGVPDLHSRKPNLKTLFEPMLPSKYEALEVFARNLTAGWWAWGNEVLKFQSDEHWIDPSNET